MSNTDIETEWAEALKRAAELDDEDFRYALCEGFLNRAVMRLVGKSASCSRLAAAWYDRNRRDQECAAVAQRMMPVFDDLPRSVVKIIAEMDIKDLRMDPERVGVACSELAYNVTRHRMTVYITCASDSMGGVYISGMVGAPECAAEIARDSEQLLQTLDVQKALALLARARGEAE